MKRNRHILRLAALLALGFAAASTQAADRKEVIKKFSNPDQYSEICYARKSGKWESDIWTIYNPLADKNDYKIVRGARPSRERDCFTLAEGVNVVLSSEAAVNRFMVCRKGSRFVLGNGADLTALHGCYGFAGTGSGGIEMRDGAQLHVKMHFFVAGCAPDSHGTGSFLQTGGVVDSESSLYLSGAWNVLSSSPKAVGTYTLGGGRLVVRAPVNTPGISSGSGQGHFYFGAGTLETNRVAIDLENVNGGNLSPAGDAGVGETRLVEDTTARDAARVFGRAFETPRTYRQASGATLTVNIASKSDYDRVIWRLPTRDARMVFESGATLRILPLKGYVPTSKCSFDIAMADALTLSGALRLEGATKGFSYECVDGKILRLKYAP